MFLLILLIMASNTTPLHISSTAFQHNGHIPSRFTCDGGNINPALEIGNLPAACKSIAIIVEDPDAPGGIFDHWLIWNISPGAKITEHFSSGIEGTNSFGKTHYGGPCPPNGTHRYYFNVYALNSLLPLKAGASKPALVKAMKGHILASGVLMGTYSRTTNK